MLLHVRRFAAFSAVSHGCKNRTIRFQHELIERSHCHGFPNVLAVLERQNASEADQRPQFENVPHLRCITRKTMKHTANPLREWTKLRDRLVKTIALMDHAVQPGFGRNLQMLLK